MRRWVLITKRGFPIWKVSRRVIEREKLARGRIRWVVETPESVPRIATEREAVLSISPLEDEEDLAA